MPVEESFFGLHLSAPSLEPWPGIPFRGLRTWDSWPGVSWQDLHIAPGQFNWLPLDRIVEKATSEGVEILYTFGYVPRWASRKPNSPCGIVPAGTCHPPDMSAWREFVTAIVGRYGKVIKQWELWNEPNSKNFWGGTEQDLIRLAEVAYPTIHEAGGILLSPAPQGMNADKWLRAYFIEGGAQFTDVVSFHGYLHGEPELISDLVNRIRRVAREAGLEHHAIWDTEHSWGDWSWPYGSSEQDRSTWLARFIVISAAAGLERTYWYMWDSKDWGTLFEKDTHTIQMPGVAYREVHRWLLKTKPRCILDGDVYTCTLGDNTQRQIVWRTEKTGPEKNLRVQQSQATDIFGRKAPILGGNIMIGSMPLLLESGAQ